MQARMQMQRQTLILMLNANGPLVITRNAQNVGFPIICIGCILFLETTKMRFGLNIIMDIKCVRKRHREFICYLQTIPFEHYFDNFIYAK